MKLRKVKSSTKHQVFKLYEDSILKYILKERIPNNITKSKSQFYLQTASFQFISSLYPLNKTNDLNGKFSLENNKVLTFDYDNLKYQMTIEKESVILEEVQYA